MTRRRHPLDRRSALKALGGTVLGGGVLAGVSTAQATIAVPGDEETIADAIAAAEPGDTIDVAAGVYNEGPLVVDDLDDLTLRGAGSDEVTVVRAGGSRGLTVDDSDGVTLRGFTLRDTDPGHFGLKLQFSDDLHVEDVRAVDNGRTGIDLNATQSPTLVDVEARRNDGAGIALRNLAGATVTNATTGGNAWGGLALWAPSGEQLRDVTVTDSTFAGEPAAGLFAQYPGPFAGVAIQGNRIRENGIGVLVDAQFGAVEHVGGIAVHENDVEGNGVGVLNADANDELDATHNWWGHASGPGGPDGRRNPAGRTVGNGDEIQGDVAFEPWLRRPIDHPSR